MMSHRLRPARQRLAYDELFAHQMTLALARQRDRKSRGVVSVGTGAFAIQGFGQSSLSSDQRAKPRDRGNRGRYGIGRPHEPIVAG